MTTITPEQRLAANEAGSEPIELADPQTGDAYVLMRADVFQRMRELLEKSEDRLERQAWSALAGKARGQWAQENPF
jgi:hypothetical protein